MGSRVGARAWAILAATALAAAGLVTGAAAASALPGGTVSVAFEPADFGAAKTGTTVRKMFLVTNDGIEPVTIDPAPFVTVAAPFAPISTTIVAGETITPGTSRSITVEYTAGAVGSMPAQGVVFTAVSTIDTTRSGNFAMILSGQSIATDPASFEITEPVSGVVDFGEVAVGSSATRTIVIRNNGVRDLRFESGRISVVDVNGAPLPVTIDGAPFVKELVPGGTATIDVTYSPASAGAMSGLITIVGLEVSGDIVVTTVGRELGMIGAGRAAPVDPGTPGPNTPVAVPQGGAASGASGTAAGRQLASTGADAAAGFVGGTVGVMFLLAGIALLVERRIRRSV